jgi:nicotinamidase-related amidase
MLMRRDAAQVLIIDMQDRLLDAMAGRDETLQRCVRLVRAAQILDIPITISEQYPKGLGPTNADLREALGNAGAVMEKVSFSCFGDDAIRARLAELRRKGRAQVIIGGIETHVCVTQTAIDLVENGYSPFVVADAVASRAKESRKLALARLRKDGAAIVDSEMVLFEWLGRAGTPEFKEIQALVK